MVVTLALMSEPLVVVTLALLMFEPLIFPLLPDLVESAGVLLLPLECLEPSLLGLEGC